MPLQLQYASCDAITIGMCYSFYLYPYVITVGVALLKISRDVRAIDAIMKMSKLSVVLILLVGASLLPSNKAGPAAYAACQAGCAPSSVAFRDLALACRSLATLIDRLHVGLPIHFQFIT